MTQDSQPREKVSIKKYNQKAIKFGYGVYARPSVGLKDDREQLSGNNY